MIRFEGFRPRSLGDLLEQRADLRRQEILLASAAREVGRELQAWHRHRLAERHRGRLPPTELSRVWNELERREIELRLDLVQVRHALAVAGFELDAALHSPNRG